MFVWLFLALLRLPLGLRVISTAASHLRMFSGAHLSVTRFHLILLVLAAHTHRLLLVMLHLLLMMLHLLPMKVRLLLMVHLLIHAMLAFTGACLVGSFVHSGLVSFNILVVAVKIFSLVFISRGLVLTFFHVLRRPFLFPSLC